MSQLQFILTTNSPGEVAGWLTPVARELKRVYPHSRIIVFVPPCTFASGKEVPVIKDLSEVDGVFGPTGFLRFLLRGRLPGFSPSGRGLVIFLGGDLTHAVLLAKRTGYPAVAYTDRTYNWGNIYREFYVPSGRVADKIKRKGAPEEKVKIVGDLMLDAAGEERSPEETRKLLGLGSKKVLTFFPGSRPKHFAFLLPFYWQIARQLLERGLLDNQNYALTVAVSPFIPEEALRRVVRERLLGVKYIPREPLGLKSRPGKNQDTGDKESSINQGNPEDRETKERGKNVENRKNKGKTGDRMEYLGILREEAAGRGGGGKVQMLLVRNGSHRLMEIADLAVTIPGTNNMELAAHRVPALVLLPLNRVEDIPLPGLAGILGDIPIIGKKLKEYVVNRLRTKLRYLSIVNRELDEEVFPELVGVLDPGDVVFEVAALLPGEDRPEAIREKLGRAFAGKGAACRLVRELNKHLPAQ